MNLLGLETTNSFLPNHQKEALLITEIRMLFWLQDCSRMSYQQQLIPSHQTKCCRWNRQPKSHTCWETLNQIENNVELCWYSCQPLSCGAPGRAFWMMSGPEVLLMCIQHTCQMSIIFFPFCFKHKNKHRKSYCILRVINHNVTKGLSRINKLNNLRKNVNIDETWKIRGMMNILVSKRNILLTRILLICKRK